MTTRQSVPEFAFTEATELQKALWREADPAYTELREAHQLQQARVVKLQARTDEMVDAIFRAARAAALAQPPTIPAPPARDRRGSKAEEMALLHTTDWQAYKFTRSFSVDILGKRLDRMDQKVARLTELQREHHPVRVGHIMFGGDMVEGINIFAQQSWSVEDTMFGQLFGVVGLLEARVIHALAVFETVHVYEEKGNHGRIGRKGENPACDNWDLVAYEIVRQKFEGNKRLVWHRLKDADPDQDFNVVDAGNYRAILMHGDEIPAFGGQVPAYSILRKANAWASGSLEIDGWKDMYFGHFHTPMMLAMANGNTCYVTGSPESGNTFARTFVAAVSRPSQRLHFIDPEKGQVSAEYSHVWLDD